MDRERAAKNCTTHHLACDCREEMIYKLRQRILLFNAAVSHGGASAINFYLDALMQLSSKLERSYKGTTWE